MIFLDVTSACHSPLNTGVKRMQRGLHEWLKTREDYLPICWQSAWQAYRTLKRRDFKNLQQSRPARGLQLYDSVAPGLFNDWLYLPGDSFHLLDLFKDCRPVDLLLMPDLLWDNRASIISRLWETGLHRVGFFHDAIALRRPRQSRIDRYFCARGIRALAKMDTVICISKEAEDDLLHYWDRFGCTPTATFVIPWPVPFSTERPELFPNFHARKLLYVARLEAHKNHARLLEACEKLWQEGLDFSLRLIGCKAYPDTAWNIARQIRRLRSRGRRIEWDTHVSESTLHEAYQECSFTTFPSLLEGFGLPIAESLWHGRPVVCGDNGALGEISRGGGCAIANTESVSSLATEIRRLLTDESSYEILYLQAQFRAFRDWAMYWRDIEKTII